MSILLAMHRSCPGRLHRHIVTEQRHFSGWTVRGDTGHECRKLLDRITFEICRGVRCVLAKQNAMEGGRRQIRLLRKVPRHQLLGKQRKPSDRPVATRPIEYEH